MNSKLADSDFVNLETPEFLDMKEKANKFLYGDWHGFSYVLDSALMIIGQVITLIGLIAIVAALNPWILLVFFMLVLAHSAVEAWAKKREITLGLEAVKVERRWMYFSGLFTQFQYGKELRINQLKDWLLSRQDDFAKQAVEYYRRRSMFNIKSGSFGAFTVFLQQGVAYGYIIRQVVRGVLGIGDFALYIGAITNFSGSMRTVMSNIVAVKAYGIYYDALKEYLNIPQRMRMNKKLPVPDSPHTVEFRHVTFRYPGQNIDAIHDLNITLNAGQRLAVVGENGAGKTTFVKLLARIYDPTEGDILINGVNIRDIDYNSYMGMFSVVFQDYKLFSLSLKENITLGKEVDDKEVMDVLIRMGLDERVKSLAKGLHTMVYKEFDEQGFEPSGGEGQRIAIARALLRNAPFVVLDEPTAALDPRAEYEIYQRFDELVQDKTTVYISHRLSSTRFCDVIAVFHKGEIVEYDTHDELIKHGGIYSELFNMQAQYYVDS